MTTTTKGFAELYIEWFQKFSSERTVNDGWIELTLPLLDHHNDFLRVLVTDQGGRQFITDGGKTISELKKLGCEFKPGQRRRQIAKSILRGFGLNENLIDEGVISANSTDGDFPWKLHGVLLAMLALDGLANISPSNVAAFFKDDVFEWLQKIGAEFSQGVELEGSSGAKHHFDFLVRPRNSARDSVLHTIGTADKMHVQSFIYEVLDTRDRMNGSSPDFYVMFSDKSKPTEKNRRALLSKDIDPWEWSNRDELTSKLLG